MKLKSLLLGSAAAMIAVTGARAADAVIAEPEPMEYVKVCDMYGAGFFYIPGTETCLKFSGYVRSDFTYVSRDAPVADTSRWDYRVRFNIDARNETDWGTLRSQIRFQSDGNGGWNRRSVFPNAGGASVSYAGSGDGWVDLDRALISLAGFRLGYSDSFTTTFHGYGLPVEKYDGPYGYDQAIFFDYSYSANGFTVAAGVQDSTATWNRLAGDPLATSEVSADVYIGAKYAGSWGNIAASYIYEDRGAAVIDSGVGAWKVSAEITAVENLTIKGFYVGDSSGVGNDSRAVAGAGDYAWGIGANYQVMDNFWVRGGYADTDVANTDFFVVGARWDPVPGLSVRPEAAFFDDRNEFSVRVYRNW